MNLNCWFGHGDRLRARDASGKIITVCERCQGDPQPFFGGEMIKGPLIKADPVMGQPTGKAQPEQPAKPPLKFPERVSSR